MKDQSAGCCGLPVRHRVEVSWLRKGPLKELLLTFENKRDLLLRYAQEGTLTFIK